MFFLISQDKQLIDFSTPSGFSSPAFMRFLYSSTMTTVYALPEYNKMVSCPSYSKTRLLPRICLSIFLSCVIVHFFSLASHHFLASTKNGCWSKLAAVSAASLCIPYI